MRRLFPGLLVVLAIGAVALALAEFERRLLDHTLVDALVFAMLLGMIVRSVRTLPASLDPGIDFAGKQLLEVAIVLLGASVDLPLLLRAGPSLAIGIVVLVIAALAVGYGIGRAFGLPHPLAVLVAAGNAICGNSAIAAVAPVIGAKREQVASAIAFTAILGVVVVIGLPFLIVPLGLSSYEYGVLAGLTVYAVPQVLAATVIVNDVAVHIGTLVKLVRVLMLGPVVLYFTLSHRNAAPHADASVMGERTGRPGLSLARALPWFIIGFVAMALLRSAGVLPSEWASPLKTISGWLTILAMAALGLGVDLRALRKVGQPVILTVTASLVVLIAMSVTLIRLLPSAIRHLP